MQSTFIKHSTTKESAAKYDVTQAKQSQRYHFLEICIVTLFLVFVGFLIAIGKI